MQAVMTLAGDQWFTEGSVAQKQGQTNELRQGTGGRKGQAWGRMEGWDGKGQRAVQGWGVEAGVGVC